MKQTPFKPKIATCAKCTADRKGAAIVGLQVIRGLKPDGRARDGGTILDPESGSVYRRILRLHDGGAQRAVRGYIDFALLGLTQIWQRVR